jgi:hypothetical protein
VQAVLADIVLEFIEFGAQEQREQVRVLVPIVASRPEAAHYATRSLGPGSSSSARTR